MRKFWQKRYISKYTGKEIDDAVAKAGTALQNPMTAAGDLIVGGEDGAAEKLVKGTDGKVLKMVSGAPAWADDAGGMENPMTAAGDLIVGGTDGAASRLGKGTDGQVLSMVSGAPAWAAASGGDYHLYWHTVRIVAGTMDFGIVLLNTSATSISVDDIKDIINAGGTIIVVTSKQSSFIPHYLYKKATGFADECNLLYEDGTVHNMGVTQLAWNTMNIQPIGTAVHQIF